MSGPFPAGWHDVVRTHYRNTAGYVVAESGTCLEMQRHEGRPPQGKVRGRDFRPLTPDALAGWAPPPSWFMAIILCPGDNVMPYTAWHRRLPTKDRDRVVFFMHKDVRGESLDKAWASGDSPLVVPLPDTWAAFHHTFGRLHGDRVFRDHAGKP